MANMMQTWEYVEPVCDWEVRNEDSEQQEKVAFA